MTELTRSSKIGIWAPTAFCVFLSIMKMFSPEGSFDPAFYSFLPICFFFVGIVHQSLWTRIESLEAELPKNVQGDARAT